MIVVVVVEVAVTLILLLDVKGSRKKDAVHYDEQTNLLMNF